MEAYKNINGNSGIDTYEIGNDYIIVKFKRTNKQGRSQYRYTYASASQFHIEKMKSLAIAGCGLNAYISQNVYKKYEK